MKIAVKKLSRYALAGIAFLALLMPTLAIAQDKDPDKQEKSDKKEKKEKKDKKKKDKDNQEANKAVERYDQKVAKAKAKYAADPEFRAKVDRDFRQIQREHTEYAYNVNTKNTADEILTYSGDKIPRSDTLYDNTLAQDYVNRLGQSLVPKTSGYRYGFKITRVPVPDARSLSTGTVYISTGLISLIDNEAQLAYVLAHEIAHVEKEHWREDVLVDHWLKDDIASQQRKAGIAGAAGGALGGMLLGGNNKKSLPQILDSASLGSDAAKTIASVIDSKSFNWQPAQEDEADEVAMGYILGRSYDVREVSTFYETLKTAAEEDPRIKLQQYGDRTRNNERTNKFNQLLVPIKNDPQKAIGLLQGALSLRTMSNRERLDTLKSQVPSDTTQRPDSQKKFDTGRDNSARAQRFESKMSDDVIAKLQRGELMAGDGEFVQIMATLKRDNGIDALYHDMFGLAERNLKESVGISSDDPLAYFFYGKVLDFVARTPEQKVQARQKLVTAAELDQRGAIPQVWLSLARSKMSGSSAGNPQEISEIKGYLTRYVNGYRQVNGGALPRDINFVYDYMRERGEPNWSPTAGAGELTTSASPAQPAAIPSPQP